MGAIGLAGSGGTTMHKCGPEDQTSYCKFSRFVNMVQMIVFILVNLAVVYFLFKIFVLNKKRR